MPPDLSDAEREALLNFYEAMIKGEALTYAHIEAVATHSAEHSEFQRKYLVLVMAGFFVSQDPKELTEWSGLPRDLIDFVYYNLKRGGLWTGTPFMPADWGEAGGDLALLIDSMVALGVIERTAEGDTGRALYRMATEPHPLIREYESYQHTHYACVKALIEQHDLSLEEALVIVFVGRNRRAQYGYGVPGATQKQFVCYLRRVKKVPKIPLFAVDYWRLWCDGELEKIKPKVESTPLPPTELSA